MEGIEREPGLIVTTASADVPLKGLSYLVEAVRMLKASGNCDLKLAIIGQPKAESPVQRSVEKLGLKDSIQFLGRVTQQEMVGLYARASVAVVPSLYEGFSLPAIEIMACGVPLIVTDGGALPEVVGGDGTAARIVRAGDSAALAREIAAVLSDGESAQKMGHRAILRARSKFSWRAAALGTVDKYLEVLDKVAASRPETTEASSCDNDAFLDEVAP
jgi:glycosyltransferase involved in cell wall biosynthesis